MVDVLEGPRTRIRALEARDEQPLLAAVAQSRDLHGPWFSGVSSPEAFRTLLGRVGPGFVALVLEDRETGGLVGQFNFSQVFLKAFRSAYLGYAALAPFAGTGRMSEGLELAVAWGFSRVGLHRIEANIQPENVASVRLVQRVGFVKEGYSEGYLFLDGAWRDHERWAIRTEIFKPRRTGVRWQAPPPYKM
mgnify:FL=1